MNPRISPVHGQIAGTDRGLHATTDQKAFVAVSFRPKTPLLQVADAIMANLIHKFASEFGGISSQRASLVICGTRATPLFSDLSHPGYFLTYADVEH
jgi:hypothetical protein